MTNCEQMARIIALASAITEAGLIALADVNELAEYPDFEWKAEAEFLRNSISATLRTLKVLFPGEQFAYIWFRTEDGTEYATRYGSINYKAPEIIFAKTDAETRAEKLQNHYPNVNLAFFDTLM